MSQDIVKHVNNAISLENSSDTKEEFQDDYYPRDKVCISKTTITDAINTSSSELNGYIRNDETRKYGMLSVDHIKTDLSSTKVEDRLSNNVKIEDGIRPVDIQIEFCNELQFCKNCEEVYEDYCTKCRVLIHILNKSPSHNSCNKTKELPKCMLETRDSFGRLGIFSLKVIPEDVRFGPFTGLNTSGVSMKIKGGKFVVSDNKSEHLNWMQYINSARNIYEQNLFPFQYQNKLYYRSTCRIEEGEELLVYFGEEYEDNRLRDMEMDFVPTIAEDVENAFACIFCCLGFSSKEYLAEHKAVSHSKTNEIYSVEGR